MGSTTDVRTTGPADHAAGRRLRVVGAGVPAESGAVSALAGTYARMVEELAAMVQAEAERSARWHAVLAGALGELHTALAELVAVVARGEW